jgi:hypothetical protein
MTFLENPLSWSRELSATPSILALLAAARLPRARQKPYNCAKIVFIAESFLL